MERWDELLEVLKQDLWRRGDSRIVLASLVWIPVLGQWQDMGQIGAELWAQRTLIVLNACSGVPMGISYY